MLVFSLRIDWPPLFSSDWILACRLQSEYTVCLWKLSSDSVLFSFLFIASGKNAREKHFGLVNHDIVEASRKSEKVQYFQEEFYACVDWYAGTEKSRVHFIQFTIR